MKKLSLLIISILICSAIFCQNKTEFEKNGIKVNFQTTKLGVINNNEFELIKDMGLPGKFVFLPDKKSVVIRHNNGNDELLKVISVQRTPDKNYVFECNKKRVLFISPNTYIITYSIEGNSSLFLFPIISKDIEQLKTVPEKFKVSD